MKDNKKRIMIGRRQPLVENLLLIDGITRAGKFLLANLLGGIKGVEPVQYHGVLEHLGYLRRLNFITKEAARELLRTEIDETCYELLIGRNINHRKSDKSSIFNNPHYRKYLKRLKQKDKDAALTKFYKNDLSSLFIVHETLPNIKIFVDTFPKIKIIVIQRSPVDLVYSWYQRKLDQKLYTDPLQGEIPIKGSKGNMRWYLYNHEKEYNSLSGIDRVILSISVLLEMYKSAYKKLSPQDRKKILFVRFEDILLNPKSVTKTMAKFLKKEILPEMKWILKKEKLPNNNFLDAKNEKIKEIKALATKKYFKQLMAMKKSYLNDS